MIIGTAGHIDHGKTALVRRLTGIDTDRLPDEKRRGMTIDLGFAHLDLPGVGRVGVVDVPGHERFVRNMVAGATGMDLVLLVVAADDGIMPQTLEHLDIVLLLGITRGVIALNKSDLVDAARLRAVTDDIHVLLRGTPLETASVVPVSAHTGTGLDELRGTLAEALRCAGRTSAAGAWTRESGRAALAGALGETQVRAASRFFRLPIDRVFTMPGHGTVVTGTVVGGVVTTDDRLRLMPVGGELRVRGVQIHNRPAETASAGNRCALNVAGVEKNELARGMMAVDARLTRVSQTADALITLSRHMARPPRNHQSVQVHAGTAETPARLLWLENSTSEPGPVLGQIRFEQPVPLLYGDRFLVRSRDARHTLGGGVVLDPFAARRGARQTERLAHLRRLVPGDVEDALNAWLEVRGESGWFLPELAEQLGEAPESLLARIKKRDDVVRKEVSGVLWVALAAATDALAARLLAAVRDHLAIHPSAAAMPPGALHASVCPKRDARVFKTVVGRLVERGELEQLGEGLRPRGYRPRFSGVEEKLAERIEKLLGAHGATPPKLEALAKTLGQPVAYLGRFLVELERAGRIVKLANGVYLTGRDFENWRKRAENLLKENGKLTLGEFRSAIGVGRELALMALEQFDRQGITRRQGDTRVAALRTAHR